MIRKIIILIAAVLAFAVLADYAGPIKMTVFEGKPNFLEVRDHYILKTPQEIETNAL